jgi:glycosyltransferase involved in cell wall biosynthesis
MNILFFTRRFYPQIGGVEKHVMEISTRLVSLGYRIIVITELSKDIKSFMKEEIDGIEIYRINVGKNDWFKKFRIWFHLFKFKKIIQDSDIIHCHDVFFWYLPFKLLFFNKPVYTTFHGYETHYPPAKKARLIRKISEKLSFGNICVGAYITKWYQTKSNYILYGGVSCPNKEIRLSKYSQRLKISFIGRLELDTGVSRYILLLDELLKRERIFTFSAIGDGSLRRIAQKYGKVIGFVKYTTHIIQFSDLILTSSYLSILEAMVSKRLVIATYDNPLKEDYLRMTPYADWIVIEKDPKKLAERVIYYMEHPKEKDAMIEKAYQWAKLQTWDKVVDTYLQLWKLK